MATQTGPKAILANTKKRWLVTGAAGFIGSHLVEVLLEADQEVVGLDNFATGHQRNLDQVLQIVGSKRAAHFRFIEGDIRDEQVCAGAMSGIDVVLHQAALGSVPRSVEDPLSSNAVNVSGFLTMLVAAQRAGVERFVYASSSSVYGDNETLPKRELDLGAPLSPYAATKYANELYAKVYWNVHRTKIIGLRYFNVFGARQDPAGAYAAVIPRWCAELVAGKQCTINGDGTTSRDFCYVENVVSANFLAAVTENPAAFGQAFNIACGEAITLRDLHDVLARGIAANLGRSAIQTPHYAPFRTGDIKHSLADITAARDLLGFEPRIKVGAGLEAVARWYCQQA